MKIANPKTEVKKGMELNDKDYISCLLSNLKEMEKNYAIALTEASNQYLYDKYRNIFLEIADLQREVFELMFRKGWYSLEEVDAKKRSLKFNSLLQEYQDIDK